MATPVANSIPLLTPVNNGNGTLTDEFISGLVQGGSWTFGGGPRVITYSFDLNFDGPVQAWPQGWTTAVEKALAAWEAVANFDFVRVGTTSAQAQNESTADIALALAPGEGGGFLAALGIFPDPAFADEFLSSSDYSRGGGAFPWPRLEGDISFDNLNGIFSGGLQPGRAGFHVILHEIGHALGLKHTGDDGANGRPTFAALGLGSKAGPLYTVMNGSDIGTEAASSPMLADIAAIQHLYGANMSYHVGNDTYQLAKNGYIAIWDAGGVDTLSAGSWVGNVTIDLNAGGVSGGTTAIAYNVTIEHAIGASWADRITGNQAANRLTGNAGNDTLNGGAGRDTMIGGLGQDVYFIDRATDLVQEQGGGGTADLVQSTVTVTLPANVEHVVLLGGDDIDAHGSAGINKLTGNSGDNVLDGGAGNDTLAGAGGADTLIGGAGNDVYVVGDAVADVIVEGAAAGIDRLETRFSVTMGPNVENLRLLGTGNINGTGDAVANQMEGNGGSNRLVGAGGDDKLYGHDGDDRLEGGADDDLLDGGFGNDALFGGTGDNYLDGGGGNDMLFAGAGEDVLYGRAGNDRLESGDNDDTLDGADGNDTLLAGGGDDLLSAGTGNDVLDGGAGDDTLDGSLGRDTFAGGAGDDLYDLDNALEVVSEGAEAGIDTVRSSASHALSDNVENLELLGTGHINGTGNDGDNELTGNEGRNTLIGRAGSDALDGGVGNDVLNGGEGNDTLAGGAGLDTLRGGAGDDVYHLEDLAPQITFEISGDPGEPITGGQTYAIDSSMGATTVAGRDLSGDGVLDTIELFFNGPGSWHLNFSTRRTGLPMQEGTFDDGERYPFEDAGHPGLSISGNGAGWNALVGEFTVLEADFTGLQVNRFSVTFEQIGEGSFPAMHGSLQITDEISLADTVLEAAGGGTDTIVTTLDLDLTALAAGQIQHIERIDLAGDSQTLTLGADEVLAITTAGTLTILGDADDTVNIEGDFTAGDEADGFRTYTVGAATLLIDTDIVNVV